MRMRRRANPAKPKGPGKPARSSPRGDGGRVRDLKKRLAEALEQQTATSEILRVISTSTTDVQPVFQTITEAAVRLCGALFGSVYQFDGRLIHMVAHHNYPPAALEFSARLFPTPPTRRVFTGRAILERRVVYVPEVAHDEESASVQEQAEAFGFRSVVSVPMLQGGRPIGAITLWHSEAAAFSESHVSLLKTFADQAVIAIENVRLFTELQEKNRALIQAHGQVTAALEQQTATSDVLRIIASSPTDIQPVFAAIAERAVRLCGARFGRVYRYDGELVHMVAAYGLHAVGLAEVHRVFPRPASDDTIAGRVISTRQPVVVRDIENEPTVPALSRRMITALQTRSQVTIPMLRAREAIGAMTLGWAEPEAFDEQQIALLRTFADQAVIAIENARLFTELQVRNADLTQALDRQTATAEILRAISRSRTEVQPVFDAIVDNAIRLFRGWAVAVMRSDGQLLHLAAARGGMPGTEEYLRQQSPWPIHGLLPASRCVAQRALVHIQDAESDASLDQGLRDLARTRGWRSCLAAPLLRDGQPIGAITITRAEAGPFSPAEVELLQTFADQAVIAVENVRLFNDTKDALERQTATSEILRVISTSPTDVQPTLDAIAARAMQLCDAVNGLVIRFDGQLQHLAAHHNVSTERLAALRRTYPRPPSREGLSGRAILTRAVVHIPDVLADPEYALPIATTVGYRSALAVPMLHEGRPVGTILVARDRLAPFSDKQIAVLQTFADQAVIAIQNVRLFTELQTSNRELTTALDTQTATSDILRVISRSQTDVQPVFDAILSSAVRLLGAYAGAMSRVVDKEIELAAFTQTDDAGAGALRAAFPQSLQSELPHAQAIRNRTPLNIADAQTDPRLPEAEHIRARVRGFRSRVLVPLLLHEEAIGAMSVARREPGGFNADEILLLQTFADQAVIAIENARLFKELDARTQDLTRSVGELQALGEVGQAISSTLDLRTVLSTIVARATQLSGTDAGVIYEYDEPREVFVPRATEHLESEIVETMLATPVRKGEGATGRLAEMPEPIQVPDILAAPAESRVRGALVRAGYRALLAVPLVAEDHLLGGLTVIRKATGAFAPNVIELLRTFSTQSALAIQNARLFREIEDKSRQLEAASRHKSEFLANMSHELRTPLNAVIGFSEVLLQRMFGDLNDKQEEYLKDIYASGQHLLSLINDILDLSKIEAGRMELAPAPFNLPGAVDNAVTLVKERAARHGITLQLDVDPRLGELVGDERKIKQVLLNLLSNAVKFTPEGGRISLKAGPRDGMVEIAVADTGIGIAPKDQAAVFEEFRQVGTDEQRKQEGTGLGLTLAKKFVELHGGRIWVESAPGRGSTFTFTLPVA
jgi:GAF domain-containing protein/anti-sigma regulatory factor (Ser/Thr protein kinase)